jgi:hypothetical protein
LRGLNVVLEHPGLSALEEKHSTPIGVRTLALQHDPETAFQGSAGVRRGEEKRQ